MGKIQVHIQNVFDPFAKQLKNALNVQKNTTPPGHNLITSTTSNNYNALVLHECNLIILDPVDIKLEDFSLIFFLLCLESECTAGVGAQQG